MSRYTDLEQMLVIVAQALGDELLQQVVFVGGCTTGLLITDKATLEAVRYTDDVDLITHVIGYSHWVRFQQQLNECGFVISPDDNVICRMRLGELKVDFMPDDASILGFSNRWYADTLEHSKEVTLSDGTAIRLITPPYFIATKLEAYDGRGNKDPLASHDIEDLLNIVDGCKTLQQELEQAEPILKTYIAQQISLLLTHRDFEYAVQATARNIPAIPGTVYLLTDSNLGQLCACKSKILKILVTSYFLI